MAVKAFGAGARHLRHVEFANGAQASEDPSVNSTAAAAFARLSTSGLVALSPRFAAGILSAAACGTLLLLWAFRRRTFIVSWALGWALASAALLLAPAAHEDGVLSNVSLSLGGAGVVTAVSLFLDGIRRFRGAAMWRRPATFLLGALAVLFALPATVPTLALFTTAVLAIAGFAVAGWRSWNLAASRRMAGAALMAVGFTVIAATTAGAMFAAVSSSGGGVAARVVLGLLGAALVLLVVGQHLFVFEDMLAELADSSRELSVTKAELHEAAITDALTQLYNRRLFDEVAVHHIEHHRRFNLPLALIYIDVDRFKDVNDTLGHAVGDRVLRHVSDYLRNQVREADYVFRLGGDEFVVLISCGAEEAEKKVLDLQSGFHPTLVAAGLPTALSLSVGLAQVPEGARDLDQTIQQADARMYEDKRRRAVSAPGRVTHG